MNFKDVGLSVAILAALTLLILYNYTEVKQILLKT